MQLLTKKGVCVRQALLTANFLVGLCGIASIASGLWVLTVKKSFVPLVGTYLYVSVAYLLTVVGCLTVLAVGVSVFALWREYRCLLYTAAATMMVLFLLYLLTGIMSFVFQKQMDGSMHFEMVSTSKHFYGDPDYKDITNAWDRVQREYHCCGIDDQEHNLTMWRTTKWYMQQPEPRALRVPTSCCHLDAGLGRAGSVTVCQQLGDLSSPHSIPGVAMYYSNGCLRFLRRVLIHCSFITGIVAIVSSFMMLLPAIFGVWFARLVLKY